MRWPGLPTDLRRRAHTAVTRAAHTLRNDWVHAPDPGTPDVTLCGRDTRTLLIAWFVTPTGILNAPTDPHSTVTCPACLAHAQHPTRRP